MEIVSIIMNFIPKVKVYGKLNVTEEKLLNLEKDMKDNKSIENFHKLKDAFYKDEDVEILDLRSKPIGVRLRMNDNTIEVYNTADLSRMKGIEKIESEDKSSLIYIRDNQVIYAKIGEVEEAYSINGKERIQGKTALAVKVKGKPVRLKCDCELPRLELKSEYANIVVSRELSKLVVSKVKFNTVAPEVHDSIYPEKICVILSNKEKEYLRANAVCNIDDIENLIKSIEYSKSFEVATDINILKIYGITGELNGEVVDMDDVDIMNFMLKNCTECIYNDEGTIEIYLKISSNLKPALILRNPEKVYRDSNLSIYMKRADLKSDYVNTKIRTSVKIDIQEDLEGPVKTFTLYGTKKMPRLI